MARRGLERMKFKVRAPGLGSPGQVTRGGTHLPARRVLAAVLTLALLWVAGCGGPIGGGGLAFEDAWARSLAPGQSTTAAYGRIANRDARARTILAWSSDSFERVSVYQTDVRSGVSSEREFLAIGLLPLESKPLKPGGMYLKLTGAKRQANAGDSITLTAEDDSGARWTFTVPVEAR